MSLRCGGSGPLQQPLRCARRFRGSNPRDLTSCAVEGREAACPRSGEQVAIVVAVVAANVAPLVAGAVGPVRPAGIRVSVGLLASRGIVAFGAERDAGERWVI